jgi:hypothetical protein
MLKHKVNITVKKPGLEKQTAIKTAERKIHRRFLRWLLGDEMNVLVVSPGPSIRTVEIQELSDDEKTN